MVLADFNSGKTLQATIAQAIAVQGKNATVGAKAAIMVVDADNKLLVSSDTLQELLGDDYTAACDAALATINADIAQAKTDAETAFGLLGA